MLDTARLKQLLSERLHVDARSVHAVIIGEHGDSELAVYSSANVSGVDLPHFCALRGYADPKPMLQEVLEAVRTSAYAIISRKGATYYGVAMAVSRIAECIVRDEKAVLPVSTVLSGEYGLRGLALSIPSVLGAGGVEAVLEIPLSGREQQALRESADRLRSALEEADLPQ